MFYVYVLKNSIDDSIFYVGKGQKDRMFRHIVIAKSKSKAKNKNPKLYNKILSILNSNNFVIPEIIFKSESEQECLDYEILKIKEIGIDNLTNLTYGGEGTSGFKISDETKQKMSDAKKKYWEEHGPYIVSDETRIKIGLKSKGRKSGFKDKSHSYETKQKMSDAKLGKPVHAQTEETRKKISESIKKYWDNKRNNQK